LIRRAQVRSAAWGVATATPAFEAVALTTTGVAKAEMRVMATRVAVRFRTGSPGWDRCGLMGETIEEIAPNACKTALTGALTVRRDHLAIAPENVSATSA
jgi:hypothetical protein